MTEDKSIQLTTQAYALAATEVKGGTHSTDKSKGRHESESSKDKAKPDHNITGSELFNKGND